jgi:hypothetical protein
MGAPINSTTGSKWHIERGGEVQHIERYLSGPCGLPSTPPPGANDILKGEGKYNILKDIFHIMQVCSNMQLFTLISLLFKLKMCCYHDMISYRWGLQLVCCIQIHSYQFKVSCLCYHQLLFMWLYAGTKSNKSHSIWVLGLCSKLYDAHPDVDFTRQGQSGNNLAAPMSLLIWQTL